MMADTQWPRFIVFSQAKVTSPHEYAGSVHAPDPEMALLNARDVFVRRPACISLWLVPAKAVFTQTREQLPSETRGEIASEKQSEIYYVFQKVSQKGSFVHVGEVAAPTPEAALVAALGSVASRSALAWWVFPSRLVTRSTPEDVAALFEPAATKDFRDQSFYHTVTAMQQLKTQSGDDIHES